MRVPLSCAHVYFATITCVYTLCSTLCTTQFGTHAGHPLLLQQSLTCSLRLPPPPPRPPLLLPPRPLRCLEGRTSAQWRREEGGEAGDRLMAWEGRGEAGKEGGAGDRTRLMDSLMAPETTEQQRGTAYHQSLGGKGGVRNPH